jgi:hypothetical protein
MTEPQMRAFAITLVFADGSMFSNISLSPAREPALAGAVLAAARENPAVPDLTGFSINEMTAEWMRATLRQMEGQPGQVVSLVSDNLRPTNPLNVRFPTGPVGGEPA